MTSGPRRLEVVSGHEPAASEAATAGIPPALLLEMDLAEEHDPARDGAIVYSAAGVRFEPARVVDCDGGDSVYARGAKVVCETANGVAWGTVVVPTRRVLRGERLPRILRVAAPGDRAAEAHLRARERAVHVAAREAAAALRIGVKLVRAEALGDGQRFAVYFASEEPFPFQQLLTAIAAATRERIELRQVGLRDAAKAIGGVGPCGLQLCCNTFLSDFAPVTIKMAKDQGLGVNPQKLSGVCGRLLCCLVYEEAFYRAQRQLVPRVGDRVSTDRGPGRVRDVNVLEMEVTVTLDAGGAVVRTVADLVRTPQPS